MTILCFEKHLWPSFYRVYCLFVITLLQLFLREYCISVQLKLGKELHTIDLSTDVYKRERVGMVQYNSWTEPKRLGYIVFNGVCIDCFYENCGTESNKRTNDGLSLGEIRIEPRINLFRGIIFFTCSLLLVYYKLLIAERHYEKIGSRSICNK